MRRKRKFMVAGIFVVAGICLLGWSFRCSGLSGHMVTIGVYESPGAGLRAAIRVLAKELCDCPFENRIYRIVWKGPDPDEGQRIEDHALLYDSKWKKLGYESDIGSGISGKAYTVDAAAIKAVAEKGGTLEDFSKYDQGEELVR
jgi:hypothetical protein